jgi:hypothetical protein
VSISKIKTGNGSKDASNENGFFCPLKIADDLGRVTLPKGKIHVFNRKKPGLAREVD